MIKSNIAIGQMFIQFPQPIAELQDAPKPRVWVKVDNQVSQWGDEERSFFVDNDAMVGIAIGALNSIGIRDKWVISDGYYDAMVREGKFAPIDDLREVYEICDGLGYEYPESRWPF